MKKISNLIILILVLVLSTGFAFGEVVDHVVISEVSVGIGTAPNEFVELYNPTSAPITINDDNFKLKFVSSADVILTKPITWTNNVIPAKGYFLFTAGDIGFTGDASFTAGLTGESGVIISDENNVVFDKVAWGVSAPSNGVEGIAIDFGLSTDESIERKSSLIDYDNEGNGWDIDDNSVDFFLQDTPNPQNSESDSEVTAHWLVGKDGWQDSDSIQEVIDVASAGDVINVGVGTYEETVNVNKEVSIIGAGKTVTIIDPVINQDGFDVTADNVLIKDLKLSTENSGEDSNIAIDIQGTDNVEINNCVIETTGNKAMGIWVGVSVSSNLDIIDNTITIANQATGIYAEKIDPAHSTFLINGNTINAPDKGVAIELYDVNDAEVDGNTIGQTGSVSFVYSSELSDVSGLVLTDNSFLGNGDAAWPGVIPTVWIESDFQAVLPTTTISDITIQRNTFNDWKNSAILLGEDPVDSLYGKINAPIVITNNNFNRDDQSYSLRSYTITNVDTTKNWWGAIGDPSSYITGTVDSSIYMNSPFDVTPNAPTLTISDDEGYTKEVEVDLTLVAGDNVPDQMAFSCNGEDWSDWEVWSTSAFVDLTDANIGCDENDGSKTVYVKVRDYYGNEQGTHSSDETILDTTPPVISFIDDVAEGPILSDDVDIGYGDAIVKKFGYVDAVEDCTVDVDTLGFSDYTIVVTLDDETKNDKFVCVYAEDSLGNKAVLASTNDISVDITPPILLFTDDVEAGPVQSDDVNVNYDDATVKKYGYVDAAEDCTIDIDAEALEFSGYTTTFSLDDETKNDKFVCVYAEDSLGNNAVLVSANDVNVDVTVPTVTNPQVTELIELGDDVEIRVNVVDDNLEEDVFVIVDGDYYEMSLEPETETTYLKIFSTSSDNRELDAGDYVISFFANDSAENVNDSVTGSFEIEDNVGPSIVNIDIEPDAPVQFPNDVVVSIDVEDQSGIKKAYAKLDDGESQLMVKDGNTFTITYSDLAINNEGYLVEFVVNDEHGNTNFEESTIFVVEDTIAPEVTNSVIEPIIEWGENVDISVDVTDSHGSGVAQVYSVINDIYYEMELGSGTTYLVSVPGLDIGEYTVTFYANDTEGNINFEFTAEFEVRDRIAPSVTINTPTTDQFFETNEVELSVTASESVNCNYSLDAGITKTSLFEDNTEGTSTISLTDHSSTINVYCEDPSGNLNDTQSVSIVMNRMPSIDPALVDQTATEDITFSYQIVAADLDEDILSYSLNDTITGLDLSDSGLITWTPVNNDNGTYYLLATVCDDQEKSNSCLNNSFALTVGSVNDAPVMSELDDIIMDEDSTKEIDFSDLVEDEETDDLDLDLIVVENEDVDVTFDGMVATISPKLNYFGTTSLIFRVSDGEYQDTKVIVVDITAVQDYPQIPTLTLPEDEEVKDTTTVTLEWESEEDVDGDVITYYVYLSKTEDLELLGTTTELSYEVELDDLETYYWQIVANDSVNSAESEIGTFSVLYNTIPEISSDPVESILINSEYNYSVIASDIDGDKLTYELETELTGMEINDLGFITWESSLEDVGTHLIKIVVSDDNQETDEQEFNLTVNYPFLINYMKLNGEIVEAGDIVQVTPGQVLTFNMEFENLFDDRTIGVTGGGFGIDRLPDNGDIIQVFDFVLGPSETIQETVEFTVPLDAAEDGYLFGLAMDLEDEKEFIYEFNNLEDLIQIEVVRLDHDMLIQEMSVNPETLNSGEQVYLSFAVYNAGTEGEEDVLVSVVNEELGINVSEVINDVFPDQDSKHFGDYFDIPETVLDGTYPIEITITYGEEETVESINLGVTHINLAPTISSPIPNITFNEDEEYEIDLTIYERDLEDSGDDLVWSVEGVDESLLSSVEIDQDSDAAVITPVENQHGSDVVTFTLTDGEGLSVSQDVLVTVSSVEDGVEITSALPEESELIIGEDETIDFSITAVDPDDTLKISWIVNNEVVVNRSEGIDNVYSFEFVPEGAGEYEIIAQVVDGSTVEEEWSVIVTEVPVTEDYEMNYNTDNGIDKATNVSIGLGTTGGSISFGDQVIDLSDVLDIDNNVKIQENLIALNTEVLAALNKPATITMKVSPMDNPLIYYNGGFTTNVDDINTICDFCEVKTYDRSTGLLTFTVEHFTSFTTRDVASVYSMSFNLNEIIFDGERGTEYTKELVITNTGSETLEDVLLLLEPTGNNNVTIKLEGSNDYVTSISDLTIVSGASKKVFVKTFIPVTSTTSKSKIADLTVSALNIQERTLNVYKDSPSKLKIINVEVDDGNDDYSVTDGGIIDEIEPDSKLQFNIEVENLYDDEDNEDQEIRSIEVKTTIKKIDDDGDDDLDEDSSSFSLDPLETDDVSLDFSIPVKVNEKSTGYAVVIEVEGKDRLGVKHTDEWDLTLYIEKEEHDLRVVEAKLEKSELSCDRSTYLDVKIQNFGSEDEKDVVIEVKSSELGISERYTAIPKVESDMFDEDSDFSHSFFIDVPEDVDVKKYPITVIVYYDDDEESDRETINLDVTNCVVTKAKQETDKKKAVELEDEFKAVEAQIYQQYEPQEIKSDGGFDSSWETTLMICGAVILLGVIAFLFMALLMIAKKKRKY